MLKSSEFNSAVPKFTNGNYASNPIDPTNVEEPSAQDYVRGTEPLDTLPAQWWNWLCNQFTSRFNKLNTYVKNIFDELTGFLSLLNITPDGTESAITTGQLKNAFKENYPAYINDKLELGTTYVKRTQKVNNHALTGDITVSKGDVGLGSVEDTGDSANASSGGITKFTTGGAYNLLSSIAPYFSTSTAYAVGALITYQNRLYECTTAHSAGAWNANHFTARSVQYVISNYILPSLAPAFSTSTSYTVGTFVTYQNRLYRCKTTHSAGAWNTSHFELATLNDINTSLGTKADLLDLASAFSTSVSYTVGDYVTYNGNLYRCTVAHSGAWNASHFTLVTVGGDLAEKTDITVFDDATTTTTHFNNAPYTSRVTGYDRASTNKIVGASFAINQLVKNGNFANTSNWTTSGATLTASGNVASIVTSSNFGSIYQALNMQSGHKYLISVDIKATTANQSVRVLLADNNTGNPIYSKTNSTTNFVVYQGVVTSSTTKYLFIGSNGTQTTVNAKNVFFIDLTQMFGSAIADRIYAMEQATAGSGIAWIKSFGFFNNAYYATDNGSIQSVKPSAHRITGFNMVRDFTAVGATSQYQAVLYADANLRPYTRYCIGLKAPAGISLYFNEFILKRVGSDSNSFQTTGNYQYFIVDTLALNPANNIDGLGWVVLKTYNASASTANITQVCISLADSRFDGQYEEYKGEWSYPLADTELRGIPKLDSDNNLYYDGDVYSPNGDVVRKYGVATVSDFTGNHLSSASGGGLGYIDSSSSVLAEVINYVVNNSNLPTKNGNEGWNSTEPCIAILGSNNGNRLRIYETLNMTLAQFQAKYANLQIVYKKLTPTEETVAGYTNPHTLIRKGAEEFVDNRAIPVPVGHETTYLSLPDWLSATDPFAIGIDSGIYTELAKKVDKTTTVNGHALSGNVTVTKGDVGLGNVANTGDSATPVAGGTTKFTTGGAYNFFGGNTNSKTWLTKLFSRTIGNSWTDSIGLDTSGTQFGVAYGKGVWVIASQRGTFWSENLTNWTPITGVSSESHSIEFKDGIFVLGTVSTGMWWSENGKVFTLATGISDSLTARAKHVGELWFAASNSDAWWSNDGKSWTTCVGTSNGINIDAIDYGNGKYFAGKRNEGLITSNDGKTWSSVSDSIFNDYTMAVKYTNGIWLIGTYRHNYNKNLITSKDNGSTWHEENITVNGYVNDIWTVGNNAIVTWSGSGSQTKIVSLGVNVENSCIIYSKSIDYTIATFIDIFGTYFAFTFPGQLMRSTNLLIWENTFAKAESSGLNTFIFADDKLLYTSQLDGAQFSEIDLNAI